MTTTYIPRRSKAVTEFLDQIPDFTQRDRDFDAVFARLEDDDCPTETD